MWKISAFTSTAAAGKLVLCISCSQAQTNMKNDIQGKHKSKGRKKN